MPLTLRDLVSQTELGLLVRSSSASLERSVRWVAASELLDPAPWIEPGDLLLTTGMSIVDEPEACAAYVERLAVADAAGIGFGVGLSHAQVPTALIAAADQRGLPVIEVPQPVPFVAVSKAVSRLLTTEEYADAAASFDSQRRMLRAVLEDDVTDGGLLPALARHVSGFALHLDPQGALVAAHPPEASQRAAELSGEIDRLRPRGLLASASIASADEHIVIVPIGVRGSAEGFLVIGSSRPLRSSDQSVVNLAVSLLTFAAMRPHALGASLDPWRRLLLDWAIDRGLQPEIADDLGIEGLNPRRAVAVVIRARTGQVVPESLVAAVQASGEAVLAARRTGHVVGLSAVADDGSLPTALRAASTDPAVAAIGVSCVLDMVDPVNVRQGFDQAEHAATGRGLCIFADEPFRGLASLLDAATTAGWAAGYLSPLTAAPEGGDLMETLRAWLASHGQVDAAAQSLGIHRHTVRHRLRRAEAALGKSLEDPAVRADLWFALDAMRPPAGEPFPS